MTLIFSLSIAQISKIFYRIPVKYWMTILVCFQLHKENVVWRINIYWLHRELSLNISKNQVTYMDAYMCFYFRPLTLKMWFFYKRRLVILGKMWKDIALENKSSIPWNERIINCEYIYFFFYKFRYLYLLMNMFKQIRTLLFNSFDIPSEILGRKSDISCFIYLLFC